MTGMGDERAQLRTAIDEADQRLVQILAERRKLGESLGGLKAGRGQQVRDTERERDVIERAVSHGKEAGLDSGYVEKLFQVIIDDSLRRQRASLDARANQALREAKVAYLGGPGSYSHFAAHAHFEGRYSALEPVIKRDFAAIFKAVESGEAQYAFLPIENTTTGAIVEVYDLMRDTQLKIAGEHHYKVEHCLVGKAGDLSAVKNVLGHSQALRQSQHFLSDHPEIRTQAVSSSTRALERAMDEDGSVAAIASAEAARLFGLNIIVDNVSDHPENYTRFVALAKDPEAASPLLPCKTSIVFSASNEAGSLLDALSGFKAERINFTRLENRPIAGAPWEQLFFLDFEGHEGESHVARALSVLRRYAVKVHCFGSYGADRLTPVSRETA